MAVTRTRESTTASAAARGDAPCVLVTAITRTPAARAADDLTIVSKTSDNNEPATTTTNYYASDRMRMMNNEGSEVMAEDGSGQVTMIDHEKKQ